MKSFVTTVMMASALLFGGVSLMSAAEQVQKSKDQVKELIGSAKTSADHRKLAAYYTGEADNLEVEARDHEELAGACRVKTDAVSQKHVMSAKTASHCDYFAKSVREAATADRELAAEHESMAKAAGK
jgi:hypothetical protein